MFDDFEIFIKDLYTNQSFIPLHEPRFIGNEKKYLNSCIDSTFVSSVGVFVNDFEKRIAEYTGSKYAVATSSGTSALHVSLLLANVSQGHEVITQPVTFVATCNAIQYCGATPLFVDVDKETMGLSPSSLLEFLENNTVMQNENCINIKTNKIIKACIPVHTFGNPCRIDIIKDVCDKFNISLIEDAAESLGSFFKNKHTGTFGKMGVISFNGNKIITAGGGGCIITDDLQLALKAKHITTTAKIPHKWNYSHDMVGFNYRMPNLNAALVVAQLENLNLFLQSKRKLANLYRIFFEDYDCSFFIEPKYAMSNNWLNTIILKDKVERDQFLEKTNSQGIMTRPIWTLMNGLDIHKGCQSSSLVNSEWLSERVVNIPSSAIMIGSKIL